jgi:hypothetical protein
MTISGHFFRQLHNNLLQNLGSDDYFEVVKSYNIILVGKKNAIFSYLLIKDDLGVKRLLRKRPLRKRFCGKRPQQIRRPHMNFM